MSFVFTFMPEKDPIQKHLQLKLLLYFMNAVITWLVLVVALVCFRVLVSVTGSSSFSWILVGPHEPPWVSLGPS